MLMVTQDTSRHRHRRSRLARHQYVQGVGNEPEDRPTEPEHDPYARRSGYVTGVDGRTDRTTTAMAAGTA
jgi:hypothetical protein